MNVPVTKITSQYFTKKEQLKLINLRKKLHQIPELAFEEIKTQALLEKELKKLKPHKLKRIAKTGLAAIFKGSNSEAPKIAIRGDIDGLPITENTGLSYTSKHPGKMHACGHDVHATWTLATAHLLKKSGHEGDIVFIFQPAEEIAKGAKEVIKSGVLKNCNYIIGAHVDMHFELPKIIFQEGPISANSDTFSITFTGKSSHGARPEEGVSPLPALKELLDKLPKLEKKLKSKTEPCVVSIGEIHAGSSHNICPGDVQLKGSIRSLSKKKQKKLHTELKEVCKKMAKKHGLKTKVKITTGAPAIYNDPKLVQIAKSALGPLIGKKNCKKLEKPNMGSEDFGEYLKHIPGSFFRIGAKGKKGRFIPAHNPKFYAEDDSIFIGAILLATVARTLSKT